MTSVSIHRDAERIVIRAVGDIDLASVDALSTQLAVAGRGDASLSGVAFRDSLGTYVLIKG